MYFTLGALFLPKIWLVHKTKQAEKRLAEQEASSAAAAASSGRIVPETSASSGTGAYSRAALRRGDSRAGSTVSSTEDGYDFPAPEPRQEEPAQQSDEFSGLISGSSGRKGR